MDPIPAPKPRRRKKALPWWVTVATLAAVLAGFAGLLYYAYLPKNGLYPEPYDADARQHLKIGTSTREDVLAWYTGNGITEVSDTFDTGGRKNGYLAQIPNDSWMKQAQIHITVRFDGTGKLEYLSVFQAQRE